MTNNEIINELYIGNHGYITSKEISKRGISSWFLTDFVRKNKLVKIDTGFYASDSWIVDGYFVFQYKYPRYVYSFLSALFLLGMTDKLPSYLEVTGPKGYHPFQGRKDHLIIHKAKNNIVHLLGIIEVETINGNKVKSYNMERTICDLIKHKENVDTETYVKALHMYKKSKGKDVNVLMDYAKIMNIERGVDEIMVVLLNED